MGPMPFAARRELRRRISAEDEEEEEDEVLAPLILWRMRRVANSSFAGAALAVARRRGTVPLGGETHRVHTLMKVTVSERWSPQTPSMSRSLGYKQQ